MSDSPTILVVDDHRDIRDLVGRYLQEHGLRVLLADGGDAVKRQLRQHSIDLVVLDIMMPDLDGYQVCERLKADPLTADSAVVFLSALDDVDAKLLCV